MNIRWALNTERFTSLIELIHKREGLGRSEFPASNPELVISIWKRWHCLFIKILILIVKGVVPFIDFSFLKWEKILSWILYKNILFIALSIHFFTSIQMNVMIWSFHSAKLLVFLINTLAAEMWREEAIKTIRLSLYKCGLFWIDLLLNIHNA